MYQDTRLVSSFDDLEGMIAELKTPWKTMEEDMNQALIIISRHAKTEFDLGLVTIHLNTDEDTELEFPDWQNEIEKHFVNQYGLNDGKLIFNKVLMRLFQMSRGTEQQLH